MGRPTLAERWAFASAERSRLCLGVAPSDPWLSRWHLPVDVAGARRYCEAILTAAGPAVAAVKIQTSFFLRFGARGITLLRWFVDRAHDNGAVVLLDAKVGDADDTMASYADLYLGTASVLGGDAVTAQCFMGFASLEPLLDKASRRGAAVFVLVRTSNHSAGQIQLARAGEHPVCGSVADRVTAWNATHAPGDPVGPAGAVVGARSPESGELYDRLDRSLVEVPGLGRADRDTAEILASARPLGGRAILTVTTGVLRHGPEPTDLTAALCRWAEVVSSR